MLVPLKQGLKPIKQITERLETMDLSVSSIKTRIETKNAKDKMLNNLEFKC